MIELRVENMTCGHCVSAVTRAVKSVDPDAAVQVDLRNSGVTIDGKGAEDALIRALNAAGYPAAAPGAKPVEARRKGCCCG